MSQNNNLDVLENVDYYKGMPEDFKEAVKVIRRYCQNEQCVDGNETCINCPYPLSVIRCGDNM